MPKSDPPVYTGQETWLKKAAHVAADLLGYKPSEPDPVAEIFHAEAPDLLVYPRAFGRYLERCELQGQTVKSEFWRMKDNAALFEKLVVEARAEILQELRDKEALEVAVERARQEALRDA